MRTVFSYENTVKSDKIWDIGMKSCSDSTLSNIDLKNLGSLIRSKRKELGLTQQEVSESISVSSQHYSRIENGEYIPSLQTFFKLVDVLNLDITELNISNGKNFSSTTYEIVTLLENFSPTQQKAVLNFLQTMRA